jgi:hypothetical protein
MRGFSAWKCRATALLLAGLLVGVAQSAQAQPAGVDWDHYWVYDVFPSPTFPIGPVVLTDQFTTETHQVGFLRHFMNPAEKIHEGLISPIHRPELHYMWWELNPTPFFRPGVVVTNQFGPQLIDVREPRFLLNPAAKNDPTMQIPLGNHYKCYDCVGQPVNAQVHLSDQFGQRDAFVTFPKLHCNPTHKSTSDGVFYPMVDPLEHLVCYEIDPYPAFYSAVVADQFITNWQLQEIGPDRYLCVPSEKHDPTPTTPSTWGRLKALYR